MKDDSCCRERAGVHVIQDPAPGWGAHSERTESDHYAIVIHHGWDPVEVLTGLETELHNGWELIACEDDTGYIFKRIAE